MHPLYLTATGALVAAIALRHAIAALLRHARLEVLATVPVEPEHGVRLPTGALVLHLAGPFGKTGLGALSFELLDTAGTRLPSRPILARTKRSGGGWGALLAVRRFEVPAPGDHRLLVAGIAPDRDFSDCALVLARPAGAGLVLSIVAVVIAAVALLVCTVFSLILWLAPETFAAAGAGR